MSVIGKAGKMAGSLADALTGAEDRSAAAGKPLQADGRLQPAVSDIPVPADPEARLRHVAIIMDGNGRWASERGLPRVAGHREGVAAARRAIETAKELDLTHLTLYSFSTENWRRPEAEVRSLMDLMRQFIESDLQKLIKENIRIRIIGDKQTLPADVKALVERAESETAANTGYILQIAFNYGGRDELRRAVSLIARKVAEGIIDPDEITETHLSRALDTSGMPDPDLVIRTSGEYRVSNFLLWQAAYSEFVFLDAYWPDFSRDLFIDAVRQYYGRERRYGGRR